MNWAEHQREHIKQLKFAVSLCQRDLTQLREGDWQNLREELYDFENLVVGQRLQEVFLPPNLKEQFFTTVTRDTVAAIQKHLAADFQRYAYKANAPSHVSVRASQIENDFVAFGPDVAFHQLIHARDPIVSARLALGYHLVGALISPSFIRSCPQCSLMFVMERKPSADVANYFCSIKCSRNAATKAYRGRMRNELRRKEKQRSRNRYEKRSRSKPGMAKVKISRRPRIKK
jgi:hypothetical protein